MLPTGPAAGETGALAHVEHSIEVYIAACRTRVPGFVDTHFSFTHTWQLQRPTLLFDLLVAPINSLWAIVYLAVRRLGRALESLGVANVQAWVRHVPAGIQTGYTTAIERKIADDLLEWSAGDAGDTAALPLGLRRELERHPSLAAAQLLHAPGVATRLRQELESWSDGRAVVTNAAGTAFTLGLSWLLFGAWSMPLTEMADRLARTNAKRRAAARFVFGRRAGGVFYSVFQPTAGFGETLAILALLTLVLAAVTMVCTICSDPCRKQLGLHERRLHGLIDNVERELILFTQKSLKPALRRPSVQGDPT